jgi:hypothetical protein
MSAADDAREHLTAVIWEVLGAYTQAPRVHHADLIHAAAERYGHALAEDITDETAGHLRLELATAEAFPGRRHPWAP